MKAMVLAAGKGTRVRPITYTIPKPMIPILQKPVMEFLLDLLKHHGFDQIMVNVSHLANEIEGYLSLSLRQISPGCNPLARSDRRDTLLLALDKRLPSASMIKSW